MRGSKSGLEGDDKIDFSPFSMTKLKMCRDFRVVRTSFPWHSKISGVQSHTQTHSRQMRGKLTSLYPPQIMHTRTISKPYDFRQISSVA